MCLTYKDLNVQSAHNCYLTHPSRNDDTDDVILDAANQLFLSKKDLMAWVTSEQSWVFMNMKDTDLDVCDFSDEFYKLCG